MNKNCTPEFILFFKWLNELEILAHKYLSQKITYDLATMSLFELWGAFSTSEAWGGDT